MEATFITITGTNHYYGLKPYKVGGIVKLVKDKMNDYDGDAIAVLMPYIDTVGYVANSPNTTFKGTYSAGRIYDSIGDYAYARVMFVTHSSVIALVLPNEANVACGNMFSEDDEEDVIHF
jgi:hypothetical protein